MPVEQIYCTHCTYGTSALEQREGELAERVLGYSARAGSLERNELRNDYRAIERFLYYYLPSDTPPEDKQRLDAASAPRRLFFCPSMGKLQMVGQVAYRQYDTAGRLGSYFAHVLFGERSSGAWTASECLRLWGAPWVEEDSADQPYKLSALVRMDQLWSGASPAINDDAMLRFLQSSPGANCEGDIITDRWRTATATQRIDLLVNALQGLLALGVQRRESVLLVVEPSVAALVFYGVARLLPKPLSEGLSFSTYEPNAERLPVTLAATTFFDPFTSDIRSDLYRRRGLVINTFQDRMSEAGPPPGNYARFIVETLLAEGWSTVDHLLAGFDAAGAKRPEDLELLARTHPVASQILSASPPDDDAWRKSDVAVRYLSQEVQHQLATAPAGWPQLHRVIGTPNHLTVLELVATDHVRAEVQRPAQFLLKKFAPERIAELLNSPLVAKSAKVEALVAFVTAQGRLPDGCQLLASDGPWLKTKSSRENSLLPDVVIKLPEPVLRQLCDSVDDEETLPFFAALLAACGNHVLPPPAVKNVLLAMIEGFSDTMLIDALVQYREPILAVCRPPEPVLGKRLGRLLYELPNHPKAFEKWLSVLAEWKASFLSPHLAERRLGEWNKFRTCLLSLRKEESSEATGQMRRLKQRLRPPPPPDYKSLAEALARAMPRRTSELDEVADVAANVRLSMSEFKKRLELGARHAGVSLSFDDASADSSAGGELFDGPGDEVAKLQRRREQQARMTQMYSELEERLLVYGDDAHGSRKLAALQQIGQVVVGRPDFLADGKRMIEAYFGNNGAWPSHALLSTGKSKHGFKLRTRSRDWTPFVAVGALAALFVPLVGYLAMRGRSNSPSIAAAPADGQRVPSPEKKARAVDKAKPPKDNSSQIAKAAAPEQETDHGSVDNVNDGQRSPTGDDMPAEAGGEAEKPAVDLPDNSSPPSDDGPDMEQAPAKSENELDASAKEPDSAAPPVVPSSGQVIHDYCSLPTFGPAFLERVELKKWPADPGPIKLAMKGLAAANEQLAGKCKLLTDSRSDGLAIAIQTPNTQNGAPNTLAMLSTADGKLSFQWSELPKSVESAEAARRQLRRCVIEAATDTGTTYLSLAAPIRREPVGLINGSKKLDLRTMFNTEFQISPDDELLLGQGYVELSDGAKLRFGEPDQVGQSALLADLPEDYAGLQAQLTLLANEKNPLDRELRLAEVIRTLPDEFQPLSDDERKVLGVLRDKLPKLQSASGKLRSWQQQPVVSAIDSHVQAISRALRIENAPTRAGATVPGEPKEYLKEIRTRIIDPAVQRRDSLVKRQQAIDDFRQAQHNQLNKLKSRVVNLAVTLCRRVDGETFVPCIVLGDADQLASEQTSLESGGEQN